MKRTLLALVFSFSVSAQAKLSFADREAWHMMMSALVVNEPAAIGGAAFLKKFQLEKAMAAHDQPTYGELTQLKAWPEFSIHGDALKISQGKDEITVELEDVANSRFLINGKVLRIFPDRSVREQLHSVLHARAPWFLPDAVAQNSEEKWSGWKMIGSAVVDAVVLTYFATSWAHAWVTVPVAVATTPLYCLGTVPLEHEKAADGSTGGAILNCMATPLAILGKNPRDRMYLNKIDCVPSNGGIRQINVSLISPTKIVETRTFTSTGVRSGLPSYCKRRVCLDEVKISREGTDVRLLTDRAKFGFDSAVINPNNPPTMFLARPENDKMLDSTTGMVDDFEYYSGLCDDPKRLHEVQAALEKNTYGKRASDKSSPEEMGNATQ